MLDKADKQFDRRMKDFEDSHREHGNDNNKALINFLEGVKTHEELRKNLVEQEQYKQKVDDYTSGRNQNTVPCEEEKKEYQSMQKDFNDLPPELVLYIFSFFNPGELNKLASVSQQWKKFSEENVLWNQFLDDKKNETTLPSKLLFQIRKNSEKYLQEAIQKIGEFKLEIPVVLSEQPHYVPDFDAIHRAIKDTATNFQEEIKKSMSK